MIIEIEEIWGQRKTKILINTLRIIMVIPKEECPGQFAIYMDWSGAPEGLNETVMETITNQNGYNKIKGVKKP